MEKDFEDVVYKILFNELFYLLDWKSVVINGYIYSMEIIIKDLMYETCTYKLTLNKDERKFNIQVLSGNRYKYYKRHFEIADKLISYINMYYQY